MKKRNIRRMVGWFTTIAIVIVSVSPSTFRIPLLWHPWILLASIVWVVAAASGVFSS